MVMAVRGVGALVTDLPLHALLRPAGRAHADSLPPAQRDARTAAALRARRAVREVKEAQ